jgi:hypothetical protein
MLSVAFPVKNRQAFPEFFPQESLNMSVKHEPFSAPLRQKSEAFISGDFGGQKSLQLGKGIVLDKYSAVCTWENLMDMASSCRGHLFRFHD